MERESIKYAWSDFESDSAWQSTEHTTADGCARDVFFQHHYLTDIRVAPMQPALDIKDYVDAEEFLENVTAHEPMCLLDDGYFDQKISKSSLNELEQGLRAAFTKWLDDNGERRNGIFSVDLTEAFTFVRASDGTIKQR